jgi:uncharacterized membrane protein YjjP (DUF1212 family)
MTEKNLDIASESLARKQHFLKLACQQLVRSGGIGTVQADYIRRLCEAMKMDADFTILPGQTTIFMKEDVSPSQGVNVLTFKTALGYNFDKLEDVEAILCDAMEGRLYGGLDEAMSALEKLGRRPNQYGAWVHPVGWSLIGCVTTLLLGGRLLDGAVAAFTGLIFGLALISLDVAPILGFTFDFWVSFIVAFLLAAIQAILVKSLIFWPAFLASVILILPGFSMAMGFTDVFTKQINFGLTTLFNAAWTALNIGLGAYLGVGAASKVLMRQIVPILPTANPFGGYPIWAHMLIYPLFNTLLNVTFQAKPLQSIIIAPLATAAFGVCNVLGPRGFSPESAILLSCLSMGILGHLYGRIAKASELPTILSGVIVFAPGTYGARCAYYAIEAAMTGDHKIAMYAFQQGAGMLTVSASMAVGILLSRAIFGRL